MVEEASRTAEPWFFWRNRERRDAVPLFARLGLRGRVMLAVALVQLAVTLLLAWLLVVSAREAVREETEAGLSLARSLVIALVAASDREGAPEDLLGDLLARQGETRHVRITLRNAPGETLAKAPLGEVPALVAPERAAPRWFRDLVAPSPRLVVVPTSFRNTNRGQVLIASEPSDEIAEAWEGLLAALALMLGAFVALLVLVHVLLGPALRPIAAILGGLEALQRGDYGIRLPGVSESNLDRIRRSVNALAARLESATRERDRLGQKLLTVQDGERKAIALELHDELGPCLFGVRVDADYLERACREARAGGEADLETMAERAARITEIANHMQAQSRSMLRRLCPVSLGQVSLVELLGQLVEGFRSQHAAIEWRCSLPRSPLGFGETVELTLYRALQEAITNAVRHGAPACVEIALEIASAGEPDAYLVRLRVLDDGRGMPPGAAAGLGLTGMSHRVRLLGGRFSIEPRAEGGTRVEIELPARALAAGPGPGQAVSS